MTPAILHATTPDGMTFPVVDVTHPAFAVSATDEDLAAMADQYVRQAGARAEVPPDLREALQRSLLGRGLIAASGTFLSGMDSYLLKLGPANLGADANPLDRAIAASFPAVTTRLRLQEMARLLADGLSRALAARPTGRVCLINIGGGPAADSWNAVILLRTEHPQLVAGREIMIAVLDVDAAGPAFGAGALDALRTADGPLHQMDIRFQHVAYSWSEPDHLRRLLHDLRADQAICAVSSEGALFEYGSDAEIVGNLQHLRAGTAANTTMVGSVTRDSAATRASRAANRVTTRPRTRDAFRDLAGQAGWIIERAIERPFTYNVRLTMR